MMDVFVFRGPAMYCSVLSFISQSVRIRLVRLHFECIVLAIVLACPSLTLHSVILLNILPWGVFLLWIWRLLFRDSEFANISLRSLPRMLSKSILNSYRQHLMFTFGFPSQEIKTLSRGIPRSLYNFCTCERNQCSCDEHFCCRLFS